MSYGAISASSSTSSSLLIPTNPAFTSSESSHKGGILVNVSRVSDDPPRTSTSSNEDGGHRPMLDPDSPITPVTPLSPTSAIPDPPSSILSPPLSMHSSSAYTASTATPRIRFAPLPDPRRPRSMSTGRNVVWKATMEPNGELTRTIAIKANEPTEYEDDDVALEDEDEGGEGDGKRGKNWGKTMSGSWKGTKKLLGYSASREKEDAGYSEGAPLKKSVSTGGFIGASPFRWTSEQERKRTMQGLPIPSPVTQLDSNHRRDSSLGSVSPTRLSSSPGPAPVKLLNGRVYGSRRASEAAERERVRREENEPAFVEWGHGKSGGGIGSNAPKTAGKGFLDDEDDGSGMEWVRRRREERERRRLEQETGQVNAPLRSLSEGDRPIEPSEAPPTPAIQVSEYASPSLTHAIEVPTRVGEVQVRGQDVFVEGSDREEEGEGDGEVEEASSDEDEEDEEEAARTTSSAAAVEKLSRHKD